MAIQAGGIIRAGQVSILRSSASLTTAYTLTTSMADLTGATLTVTTPYANAAYLALWTADYTLLTAGSLTGVVQLVVDGTAVTQPQAIWNPANVAAGARATVMQSTSGSLATAGSHTFRLQGSYVGASGSLRLNAGHTQLTVVIFP